MSESSPAGAPSPLTSKSVEEETTSASSPPRCVVVHPPESSRAPGKQGFSYLVGISAESVGARGLCLQLVTVPPGGQARAHLHRDHETAIYVLSGEVITYFGERLEESVVSRAGDFLYIPAGVPHRPVNPSQTHPCTAVIARTDPHDQESVILRPDLDELRLP